MRGKCKGNKFLWCWYWLGMKLRGIFINKLKDFFSLVLSFCWGFYFCIRYAVAVDWRLVSCKWYAIFNTWYERWDSLLPSRYKVNLGTAWLFLALAYALCVLNMKSAYVRVCVQATSFLSRVKCEAKSSRHEFMNSWVDCIMQSETQFVFVQCTAQRSAECRDYAIQCNTHVRVIKITAQRKHAL